MTIGGQLADILELQRNVPWAERPQRDHPAIVARTRGLEALEDPLRQLAVEAGVEPKGGAWQVEAGGGGVDAASQIPWIRIYDDRAPSAVSGWYVVLLLSHDGHRCFMAVGSGVEGSPPPTQLSVDQARDLLGKPSSIPRDMETLGRGDRARRYGRATAAFRVFDADELRAMADEQFREHLQVALSNLVLVLGAQPQSLPPRVPPPPTDEARHVIDRLLAYRNVVVEGVAGTGKSFLIEALRRRFGTKYVSVVVFHPATAYEDFVEGMRPKGESFGVEDGSFLKLCRDAAAEAAAAAEQGRPAREFVLVIDEINRANTARVLGDALYAIEPAKRAANPYFAYRVLDAKRDASEFVGGDSIVEEEPWIELQAARIDEEEPGDDKTYRQRLVVPDNVLILGTMNTTDRSVGSIDLALRRRFVFVRIEPLEEGKLKQELQDEALDAAVGAWHLLNQRLKDRIGADAQLGHSYFFQFRNAQGRDETAPLHIWRDLLLPQLAEILVSFNAVDGLDGLLAGVDTQGYTLKKVGAGIDAYPMVVPGAAGFAATPGQ